MHGRIYQCIHACIYIERLAYIGSKSSVATGEVLNRLVCAIGPECYRYDPWHSNRELYL